MGGESEWFIRVRVVLWEWAAAASDEATRPRTLSDWDCGGDLLRFRADTTEDACGFFVDVVH
jgi:hypothetical protein